MNLISTECTPSSFLGDECFLNFRNVGIHIVFTKTKFLGTADRLLRTDCLRVSFSFLGIKYLRVLKVDINIFDNEEYPMTLL